MEAACFSAGVKWKLVRKIDSSSIDFYLKNCLGDECEAV